MNRYGQENSEWRTQIKRAYDDWQAAQNYFENVADPDLVDFAIYDLEAARRRYVYMLKKLQPYEDSQKV